jgi:hypothetical protein
VGDWDKDYFLNLLRFRGGLGGRGDNSQKVTDNQLVVMCSGVPKFLGAVGDTGDKGCVLYDLFRLVAVLG